jgi:hypothetical protein
MAAAVVAYNTTLPQRTISPLLTASLVPVKVTYSATAYATGSGGLPFDLFAILASSSQFSAGINYKDIVGFVANGTTAEKFVLDSFAIGTATATTLPCTIRIYGTGSANKAALTEVGRCQPDRQFHRLAGRCPQRCELTLRGRLAAPVPFNLEIETTTPQGAVVKQEKRQWP